MRIIIDERETALYERCLALLGQNNNSIIQLSKEVLPLGDIVLKSSNTQENGHDIIYLIIERKSFSDLLASIKDGRYEEQSYRLEHSSGLPSPHSIIYLLEGMFSQLRNDYDKKIIYSAMTSLQFFKGFSVHRTSMMSETAEWIIHMANKIDKKIADGVKPYYIKLVPHSMANQTDQPLANDLEPANYCSVVKKVKKENITPENIGEIILCQIPGISSITAIAIMKKFVTFPNLIKELQNNPECLENLTIETNGKLRKISKTSLDNIKRFLSGSSM
jgi:hypothetical protein